MLSKGAATAALYAKDISSQATSKATELGGSVSEKISLPYFVLSRSFVSNSVPNSKLLTLLRFY